MGSSTAENGESSQRGIAYLIAPIQSGRGILVLSPSAPGRIADGLRAKSNRKTNSAIAGEVALGQLPWQYF